MALCNESQLTDFENYEHKARIAFMKIQAIYDEVMGCSGKEDDSLDFYCNPIVATPEIIDIYSDEKVVNDCNTMNTTKYMPMKVITQNCRDLCSKCHNIIEITGKNQNWDSGIRSPLWVVPNGKSSDQKIMQHSNFLPLNSTKNNKVERAHRHTCPVKVTVPEPFKMTLRETEAKKHTKCQMVETERFNSDIINEHRKKIHANPVPGHIHLPLFQKIVDMYENKKILRKQKKEERLKAIVKPFNLTNCSGKLKRTKSAPSLTSVDAHISFKAKPAPKNILNQRWSKHLKIKEEIRKLHIAQRSQAMLKESALPFTEKKLMKFKSDKTKNKTLHENLNSKIKKFKSRDQCKEAYEEWNKNVAMINHLSCTAQKSMNSSDLTGNIDKCKEFLTSQSLPFYDLPVKMTTASLLRENQIRNELKEKRNIQEKMEIVSSEQTDRDKKIGKILRPKLKDADPTLDMKNQIESKLKNLRESRQIREQEYEKELQDMKLRLEKRPLLVEMQSQVQKKDFELDRSQNSHHQINLQNDGTSNESSIFSETEVSTEHTGDM